MIKSAAKISIAEPVTQLLRIKIVECGEELVDFLQECPGLLFDKPRFDYTRATVVRSSVAEMLCRADRLLPTGYRLAVIEGWRPPHIQRRMYMALWNRFQSQHPDWSEVTMRRVVNRYSAPMNLKVPPPHTTGGAVDVMLSDQDGKLLDHTSPFEPYDPACFAFDAPKLSEAAQHTRVVLAKALLAAGLTNYPSEFWHWSYGDQGWAYRNSQPHAIYGAVTPPNWQPPPEEDIDAPLALLDN